MADRAKQDEMISKNRTNHINRYVRYKIRRQLGGYELDERGNEFKYLLKNEFEDLDGSYRVFYTDGVDSADLLSFCHHFDKTKQPTPKTGEDDFRTDVFDELTPIMLAEENCRVRILFPYYKGDNNWLVGELILDKKSYTICVLVLAHDPESRGELSNMKFEALKNRFYQVFADFNVEVTSKTSPYTSRRQSLDDELSSGVIVANELVKRINNESLTVSAAYPVGARQLRESQILYFFLVEIIENESLVESYIENYFVEEDNKKEQVLSINEVRSKFNKIIDHKGKENEIIKNLENIEEDYYKPLVRQLAQKTSFEELMDLVIVFNDLINLSLAMSDLKNQLQFLTDAAVYCQYIKTILKQKFTEEQRDKFLQRNSFHPIQRWDSIQQKFITKIRGKNEMLPKMTSDATKYLKLVKILRNETKLGIQSIDERFEHLKTTYPDDIDDHRNAIVKPIRKLFECVAEKMVSFLAQLYNDSEKMMGTPPPCRYAIIGLGSLALQQITPYSDFEFAILTELDAHKNPDVMLYFKTLTHLANLKIIGLGETIIPTSKFEVDLHHLVHVGVNFDLGGKTPLGRDDKPYNLIKTVPEMLKYFYNKDDKSTHVDKSLAYILENVCYVSGDRQLVEEYQNQVTEFLKQTHINGQKNCEVRALKILQEGAVEFDYFNKKENLEFKTKPFKSDLEKLASNFSSDEGKYFNVKQDIYRLSERMVYNMGLYFAIEGKSCWDTIDVMHNEGIINAIAHKNLQCAVSFANLLRLKTYFKNKAQNDEMSIYYKSSVSSDSTILELTEEDLEENGELFNYFYIAIALHSLIGNFCSKHEEIIYSERRNFFQDFSFFISSALVKGLIYHRLKQFKNALKYLESALANSNHNKKLFLLPKISNIYYSKGEYDLALHYLKEGLEMQKAIHKDIAHLDVAMPLEYIGSTYLAKGEYDLALHHYEESLKMQKMICKDVALSEQFASLMNSIGSAYYYKSEYNLALQSFNECLKIRKNICKDVTHSEQIAECLNNIGSVYEALGKKNLALKYHIESLDMRRIFYKNVAHPNVAISLNNVGTVCKSQGKYNLALQYHTESLEMRKIIYKNLAHPDVTSSLNNIGSVYESQGKYNLALHYHKECLEMRQIIYNGVAHPNVATSLNNIGSVYQSKREYDLALKYFVESLEMQKMIYKDVAHEEVATSLTNIGGAYHSKNEFDLALRYFKESFDMQKVIYKDVTHPDIATTINNIGGVYESKREYGLALQYFEKSLELQKIIYKDVAHLQVAASLNNIGSIYQSVHEFDLALQYYKESLGIHQILYNDGAHPEVAISLNNIGTVYQSKKEFDLAIKYYKESLEIRYIIYKDVDHPAVANSLSNIGGAYRSKKDFDSALQYLEKCLKLRKIIYKNVAHQEVADVLNNIGNVYLCKNQHNLALEYYKDSLKMRKRIYKDVSHPEIADLLNNIGGAYHSIGEYDLALEYFKESLDMRKVIYKDIAQPNVAMSLNNIGGAYYLKGEYNLAIKYFEESLEMQKNIHKNIANPIVATILNNIGDAYRSKREFALALQYFKDSLEMRKAFYKDADHPDVINSLKNISKVQLSMGEQ